MSILPQPTSLDMYPVFEYSIHFHKIFCVLLWMRPCRSALKTETKETLVSRPAVFTVSDDNSLRCVLTVQATTRWHSIFFFAVRHTHRHVPLPTTSTQLILDACGPFWSRSGQWLAPHPWPGMGERDSPLPGGMGRETLPFYSPRLSHTNLP